MQRQLQKLKVKVQTCHVCACASVGDVSLLFGKCYLELDILYYWRGIFTHRTLIFQASGSSMAAGFNSAAGSTRCALIRRIATTAAVHRSGHYKLTATRDRPLTYEQANPPYRIGVTKSWNSWNTSTARFLVLCTGNVEAQLFESHVNTRQLGTIV